MYIYEYVYCIQYSILLLYYLLIPEHIPVNRQALYILSASP